MSTSQHIPSDQPETPATFQRLAPVRERLVTAHLPSVLDEPCQTWYRHTVTRYLAQQLLARTAAGLSRSLRSTGTTRSPVVPVRPLPL